MQQASENLTLTNLPKGWQEEVANQLIKGEVALAALELDLDTQLRFRKGILVATESRILARAPGEEEWQSWDYQTDATLLHHDHAGIGHLELVDTQGLLSEWRFTLTQDLQATRFVDQFKLLQHSQLSGQPIVEPDQLVCPSCKAPLEPDQDECPICAKVIHTPPTTGTLFRLWRFAKPYKLPLFMGFVLMLLGTAAGLVPPYLTGPILDNVLIPYQETKQMDFVLAGMYLGGLFGAALLAWILDWLKTYILALVSERIGSDLRTATYEHLMKLSLEYFGGKRTGDLMARIGSGTDRICLFLSLHLLDFATDVIMLILIALFLFHENAMLAAVTLAPLPFIAWIIHLVRDRLRHGFEKIDRVWGQVTNVLADTIPGIRVVKAFAQEKREAQRFYDANRHNLMVNDRLNKVWALFSPSVSFLTDIGILVVWAFGVWQISEGAISVGVLVSFIALMGRFYGRLDSMSRIVSVTQKAASSAKRVFDILDHVSSVPEPINPVKLDHARGELELRDVGFRYGNRLVNRGISLKIKPGEMIGLVGHSGSGKSTLVNLICRFYDVAEGAILLDGVDIRSYAMSDYRRNIGLVLQEPFLFFGTVADNIAYGKPTATREEIMDAARAAHAHEFILRLPQGYDSMVGERGQGLSGGERQRISIARALLIDPRILILDEATSSVDSETEKEIQKALDNLVKGRTTIAIAHRLSTLNKADRLVVMDRGVVVEEGKHNELMKKQGVYYRLYQAQARNAAVLIEGSENENK
jgi:ATP-binding cassette subfamily B protein